MLIDLMFTGYPLSSDCIEESFELLKGDLPPEETGLKILENSFREQQTNLEVANSYTCNENFGTVPKMEWGSLQNLARGRK